MTQLRELATTHRGNFGQWEKLGFEISRRNLGEMDYISLELNTRFDSVFRDDMAYMGVDFTNPFAIFHSDLKQVHVTTEAYFQTNNPREYVRIFLGGKYNKKLLVSILQRDPFGDPDQTGIQVELEAVGSKVDELFRAQVAAHSQTQTT